MPGRPCRMAGGAKCSVRQGVLAGGLAGSVDCRRAAQGDERAVRWQERQRERARSGHLTPLGRWTARAQRESDERAASWEQRQHEKVLSGRMTFMDRWAAHAQRKGDEAAARWLEIAPTTRLLASGPVKGPSDTTAVIFVEATGFFLAGRRVTRQGTVVQSGGVVVSSGGAHTEKLCGRRHGRR
jgi:hypothetical protein